MSKKSAKSSSSSASSSSSSSTSSLAGGQQQARNGGQTANETAGSTSSHKLPVDGPMSQQTPVAGENQDNSNIQVISNTSQSNGGAAASRRAEKRARLLSSGQQQQPVSKQLKTSSGANNNNNNNNNMNTSSKKYIATTASQQCDEAASQQSEQQQQQQQQQQNICAACLKPIRERYLLMALEKKWHEDCLKCACCDCRLGEVGSSLFTHADKILCRRDFLRIFGQHGNCAACQRAIPPYELVMRANSNAYHMDCFACQQCQYRFCVGDRFHLTPSHKIICLVCFSERLQQPPAAPAEPSLAPPTNAAAALVQLECAQSSSSSSSSSSSLSSNETSQTMEHHLAQDELSAAIIDHQPDRPRPFDECPAHAEQLPGPEAATTTDTNTANQQTCAI